MLRIKLALHDSDVGAAAALLDGLPEPTTLRERVEHGTLRALINLPRDVEAANHDLAEVLTLARPACFIRTIIDQGPMVPKLLASFTPDRASQRYLEQLIATSAMSRAVVRSTVATTLVEPLSDRELTVLRYLSSRLTYQEIASALYVSLNTMKSHVRNVYRKLDVASRQEAVDAGRQLRLI
jgi:LuxR family transcriptional regulator, maltose regulon positive regulatory protein